MKTVSFTIFLIPEKLNSVIKSKSISLLFAFVNIFQRKQLMQARPSEIRKKLQVLITWVTLMSTSLFAGSIIIMKFKIYRSCKTFKLVLVIKIKHN